MEVDRVRKRSSITRWLLWWSLGISLGPLLLIGIYSWNIEKRRAERQWIEAMAAFGQIKAQQFDAYMIERYGDIEAARMLRRVENAFRELPPVIKSSGFRSPEFNKAADHLRDYLGGLARVYGYQDIFLAAPDGTEVFALRGKGVLGSNYLDGDYRTTELARSFVNARDLKKISMTSFAPFPRSHTNSAFLSAPVVADGTFIGVLIMQVGDEWIHKITADYTGLGKTGEMVLLKSTGEQLKFMAPTRQSPQSAFQVRRWPSERSDLLYRLVRGEANGAGIGKDYRGVKTVGAWRSVPSLDCTMVIKIDLSEAYEPLVAEGLWTLLILGGAIALVAMIATGGARSLSAPIVGLTELVRQSELGPLTAEIPLRGPSEIHELSTTFRLMATRVQSRYSAIEDQVRLTTRQQKTVAEFSDRVLSAESSDEFLNYLVGMLAHTLRVPIAWILEAQDDPVEMLVRYGVGLAPGVVGNDHASAKPGTALGHVMKTSEPVIILNGMQDDRFVFSKTFRDHAIVSAVGCVIPGSKRPYGVLAAMSPRQRIFDDNDVNFLKAAASAVATAIERDRAGRALLLSEKDLKRAQSVAHVGSWMYEIAEERISWSDEMYQVFRMTPDIPITTEKILGRVHPDDLPLVQAALRKVGCSPSFELEHRILVDNDEVRWIHLQAEVEFNANGEPVSAIGTTHDITERKEAAEELKRTNQALRTLSACSEALIRSVDEHQLIREICEMIVNVGGYLAAWVGYLLEDTATLSPVAHAGLDQRYFDQLQVSLEQQPEDEGPAGVAIRTSRPAVNQKIRSGRVASTIQDRSLSHMPSVALPLIAEGPTLGAMVIYSETADAFGPEQVDLLMKLADNLAFGISGLRARIERERMAETLRGISDAVLDALILMGPNDEIEHWNPAAERIFGYTRDEIINKDLHAFIAVPELREQYVAGLNQFHLTGQGPLIGKYLELEAVHKDGHHFPIGLAIAPISLRGKWGAVGIVHDNTEQKRAEAELRSSENRYRLLAEANPIGIYRGTIDGSVLFCNDAFCSMTGYSRDDFESGRVGWTEITPADCADLDRKHQAEAKASGFAAPYEKELVRSDGARIPVLNGYAFVDETHVELAAFVVDLSGQRSAEIERERLLEELKDANRRKDEFLAMLAHELRNPLAAISLAFELSERTESAEDHEWCRSVLTTEVKNLSRMIDDLLDVSRITRGKIKLRKGRLGLEAVLESAIAVVRPLMDERKHRLSCDLGTSACFVDGDSTRLEQVFVNLLSNAAKYTDMGGEIVLRLQVNSTEAVVVVEDTGIGMSPELLARAFDLFAQGDRTAARSEGGLGIGLTLVKSLVEMHGGRVSAQSEGRGKGSRFTVHLPLAHASTDAPVLPTDPVFGSLRRGSKVLVVDDNQATALGLAQLLKLLGNDVRVVHDGSSAIEEARRLPPDVLFLDIGMPGMDGYEVARQLRGEGFDKTVIIAASGYGDEVARERSRESGFNHHLVKPVSMDTLDRMFSLPN